MEFIRLGPTFRRSKAAFCVVLHSAGQFQRLTLMGFLNAVAAPQGRCCLLLMTIAKPPFACASIL
jgi:hypothetical protein